MLPLVATRDWLLSVISNHSDLWPLTLTQQFSLARLQAYSIIPLSPRLEIVVTWLKIPVGLWYVKFSFKDPVSPFCSSLRCSLWTSARRRLDITLRCRHVIDWLGEHFDGSFSCKNWTPFTKKCVKEVTGRPCEASDARQRPFAQTSNAMTTVNGQSVHLLKWTWDCLLESAHARERGPRH